jgi:acyl-CoA reductase-like NAD-dependent aldehyde dehydrogenase
VPFDDFDKALDMVDDSQFGLQAGIYTNDLDKALRAVERLNVGGVIINDVPAYRVDHMPYGGNKESGIGREGPRFAVEEMTTIKMVAIRRA